MHVVWRPSPNHNPRDARYPLQGDVSHRIVGTGPSALDLFARSGTASSHFVIGHTQVGELCPSCGPITGARGSLIVWQTVDLSRMAWTNGDVRSPTWPRYQAGVNPNLTTITTEHEDMGAAGRHIVTDHVWQASVELKRLLRSGDLAAIRSAGVHVADGAFTAAALVARMAALSIDGATYIDHHQVAGPNKPWCWRDYDGDRGFPSRLPSLLAALAAPEDTMPTPPRTYKPELWTVVNPAGAVLREQASASAPVTATIAAGGLVFTVGESTDGVWRDAVAGDPERLLYVRRRDLKPLVQGGDPVLYDGIAAVVNARAAGLPLPTPDATALARLAELEQRIAQVADHAGAAATNAANAEKAAGLAADAAVAIQQLVK